MAPGQMAELGVCHQEADHVPGTQLVLVVELGVPESGWR